MTAAWFQDKSIFRWLHISFQTTKAAKGHSSGCAITPEPVNVILGILVNNLRQLRTMFPGLTLMAESSPKSLNLQQFPLFPVVVYYQWFTIQPTVQNHAQEAPSDFPTR